MAPVKPPGEEKEATLAIEIRKKYFGLEARKTPKTETWRSAIRRLAGDNGEKLWEGLFDIAQGRAWIPTLPDGREGPPQVPTTTDRLTAYTHLTNTLFGRPVDQERIVQAEEAAAENADLRLMSDEELYERARAAFDRIKRLEENNDDPDAP